MICSLVEDLQREETGAPQSPSLIFSGRGALCAACCAVKSVVASFLFRITELEYIFESACAPAAGSTGTYRN